MAATAKNYPVRRAPSFGAPSARPSGRPRSPTPKPANDNVRPLPKPANDNVPRRTPMPRGYSPPKPLQIPGPLSGPLATPAAPYALGALRLGKIALRGLPLVGLALTAKDIYDLYQAWQQPGHEGGLSYPGWEVLADCAAPSAGPYGGGSAGCGVYVYFSPDSYLGEGQSTGWSTITYIAEPVTYEQFAHYGPKGLVLTKTDANAVTPTWQDAQPGNAAHIRPANGMSPAIDPFSLPINQPVPTPQPLPYRLRPHVRQNPYRSPVEQSHYGPAPAPRASRLPVRRPPPTGTKEQKFGARGRLALALQGVNKVFGGLTEFGDVVQSLHDALPDELQVRGKGMKLVERSEAVYKHWDKIDWNEAVDNLIRNQIEDKLIGAAHGARSKAARRLGLSRDYSLPAFLNTGV